MLGNDCVDKIDVNQTWVITRSQTSKPKTQITYADDNEEDYTEDEIGYDQHTMNDSLSNTMLDKVGSNETVNDDPENSKDVVIPMQVDNLDNGDTDYSIAHLFRKIETTLSTVVSRSELIRLQNVDVTLTILFESAHNNFDNDEHLTPPYFFIKDGLLMRKWRDRNVPCVDGTSRNQIVIPNPIRENC